MDVVAIARPLVRGSSSRDDGLGHYIFLALSLTRSTIRLLSVLI